MYSPRCDTILGHWYLAPPAGLPTILQFAISIEDSFSFETGFFPQHLIITILEKDSNEILDRREFESGRRVLAGDVKIIADESYLKDLIRSGESENVEFKEDLRSSNNWIRTVCAFSNGKGGLIFFGIDDSGTVIGLESDTGADWVTQKLSSLMEPFPDYLYVIDEVDEKKIAYLRVQSGAEKPYLVKSQGVFVRSQATTRKATRHELLAISKGELKEQ